jgi:hypothetical protein
MDVSMGERVRSQLRWIGGILPVRRDSGTRLTEQKTRSSSLAHESPAPDTALPPIRKRSNGGAEHAPDQQVRALANEAVTTAMRRLDEELGHEPYPAEFSEASLARLFELVRQFVEEAGSAAIRQARRNNCDVVSSVDVECGDRAVRSGGRRRGWQEAIGGVLAGAGAGTFLQVTIESHPSVLGLSVSAVVAAVGLVMTTAALFGRQG